MTYQVAPENVVGRDELIALIWKKLKKKSLRFTAERRVGKTTVMTKMAAESPADVEVLFLDLEGIDTVDRFTEVLLTRMKPLLSKKDMATGWLSGLIETIGGTEIGGVIKLPEKSKMGWQATLEKAVEGLCQHQSDRTIVLLFDELPFMLQKIATATGNYQRSLALTLLDTLRSLRQRHANLRMVFSGSVGLHHVISELKQSNLASEPVNDMSMIEIRSLAEADAIDLAKRLLVEEQVQYTDADAAEILQRLTSHTDCVPWYMEAVASRLGEQEGCITPTDVDNIVRHQLTNDNDPWEMEHFRSRLKIYYSGSITDTKGQEIQNEIIARFILDQLSLVDDPQSIDQVWSVVKSQFAINDRQHIVQMLKSLALDHYLISDANKHYTFRFPLIQNWWKTVQGLDG